MNLPPICTLTVEKHGNGIWLCGREHPTAEHSILLAKFATPEAAEAYKAAHARSMCFAREVGASGLG